ncbi:MAG: small, acid-soluble spore protein, alpha/beta type [Lachnospiraceae bacterium]|nr:small, acid-soluble spore protein, alpha/beta type [Lachnospiraceae bacterium]
MGNHEKKKSRKNPPEDFCFEELSDEERLKYEVAMELGLYDRVLENGWKSLSAKETGRIGGIVSRRRVTNQDGEKQKK